MRRYLTILLFVTITIILPATSHADLFSQTIGDDDNFGGSPGGDNRSSEEQSATNGAQYTDWTTNSYQRTFIFDFGVPITNIILATLETNVYDIEDLMEGEDTVDIQLNIEGYDVPGAFDDVDLTSTSDIISFDLMNLLGLNSLQDICSDGVITVDFLNAGSYQESYAIDWVSLSIEESIDSDVDGVPDPTDNCPNHPNGPDLGTCTSGPYELIGIQTCTSNEECDPNGFCSMNQEDIYPPGGNNLGDACECEADFDRNGAVDADDVTKFLEDFGRSQFNNPCP